MKINIYEPKLNIYEKPFKLLYVIIVNMAEAIQKKTRTRKTKAASLAEVQEAMYASVQAAAVEAEANASTHTNEVEVAAQEVANEVVAVSNEVVLANANEVEVVLANANEVEVVVANEVVANEVIEAPAATTDVKIPKKRGRKPKGGKIVPNIFSLDTVKNHEPNIIMHLKCGEADLTKNTFISSVVYEPNMPVVETFRFENNNELGYSVIEYDVNDTNNMNGNNMNSNNMNSNKMSAGTSNMSAVNISLVNSDIMNADMCNDKKGLVSESDEAKILWNKLKDLTYQLHTNSISDKKSACFWCTCDFDNPTILIPKFELNKIYHCYGCFCSPECATAYLFEESIDNSTRFERYHLLNHIYCKIYNYDKNIKPAPNPYYTLNKYYGNLSIQEYRKLLKNERLLLIVDKPLSRVLPELHEDNDDYVFNCATISTSNKFKIRRKTKQTKTDIMTETFNMK